jgi:signal transduction histidine kinase
VIGSNPTVSSSRLRRTGRLAAGVAVVVVLAMGAAVYTNSRGTEQVVNDAGALQAAEAMIGAADIHLKSLSQVAILATDASLGLADSEVVDAAIDEAASASSRLANAGDRLSGTTDTPIVLDDALSASDRLLDAARSGDAARVSLLLVDEAAPAHETLMAAVIAERDTLVDAVTAAGTTSGRWSRIAGFLTAFLVPLIAMGAYRQVVQRQLRLAQVQLEARLEAEHEVMEAKDRFIADISHELRTPLTSIYGFSEVLLDDDLSDPEATRDLVGLINRESGELARMVEDLLVAARDPESELSLEVAELDVIDIVTDAVHPFQRGGFEISVDAEPGIIECDQLRLTQILRNLVSNGIRYGGTAIRVIGKRADDRYFIEVRDNGDGVPKEMVPRLFTRFVHADGQAITSGSVGLGLAVAARLARAMQGNLEYERERKWTVFRVTIPLSSTDIPPIGWPVEVSRATA